jgi:SpoVK/Ycf46/Vps4 family AAA+-type ATPase
MQFVVDLPDKQQRENIWKLYTQKYELPQELVDEVKDEGWVGREIKKCCRYTYRQGMKLSEAAKFIVPASIADASKVEALRKLANGRFINADAPGVYEYQSWAGGQTKKPERQLDLNG